jgi:hypothetical protein
MSNWNFDMDLDIGPIVAKNVNKIVSEAFEENPPAISLTSCYGGGPLTLSLSLPLGPGLYEDAIYDFQLKDLVEEYIEQLGLTYKNRTKSIKWVSDALRELADTMDSKIVDNEE